MTTNPIELDVFNPSPYGRRGTVVVPWENISKDDPPDHVSVRWRREELPAQIEKHDPDDRRRWMLVFKIGDDLRPSDEHYSTSTERVEVRPATSARFPVQQHVALQPTGANFNNGVLDAFVSSAADGPAGKLYGGAFTSIQRQEEESGERFEFLDINLSYNLWRYPTPDRPRWRGHDPEKRLQVDKIRLWRPPWEKHGSVYKDVSLYDVDHRILAHGNGPVRSWVTLASPEKTYEYETFGGSEQRLQWYFCRVITMEANTDAFGETMWVAAYEKSRKRTRDLVFVTRYFMSLDMGLHCQHVHDPYIPDWFSISADFPPLPGYAFATDVHSAPVYNPPPTYGRHDQIHLGYAWALGPGRVVHTVHVFKFGQTKDAMADVAGKAWYASIYKPLQARSV